jgi:hypothetical protein
MRLGPSRPSKAVKAIIFYQACQYSFSFSGEGYKRLYLCEFMTDVV